MVIFGFEIRLPKIFFREKRNFPRYRTFEALYVDFRVLGSDTQGSSEARDISITGIRFVSLSKFAKGTKLEFTLRFTPGSTRKPSVNALGEVVRTYQIWGEKSYRVACKFENLSSDAKQEIESFVRWLKERKDQFLYFRYRT